MLSQDEILNQNQWWARSGWLDDDAHLRRLGQQRVRLPTPEVHELDLSSPAIHVVRGPRQVGKSTILKLLVERSLKEGRQPRQVIYLALDLLEGQSLNVMADSINRALELAGQRDHSVLLLDEVTAVDGWQTAVKSLWDHGVIDGHVVVCTGSSAVDLVRGAAERLPGRRGAGRDLLILPQDLANFARAIDSDIPAPPGLSISELLEEDGRALLRDSEIYSSQLNRALERYLLFGGLPAAVAEASSDADGPSHATKHIIWDSLLREVYRKGASTPALQALLERIARSLGSKTSWSRMAGEMDVPLGSNRAVRRGTTDSRTLRDYIEFLAAAYFTLVVYFWRQDTGSGVLSKDKKVYFADPLLHTITVERVSGLRPNIPALVENVVGLALYRNYEPAERRAENFIAPERLHVWGTRSGGEVDFVCGPRDRIEAVEVAWRKEIDGKKATRPFLALPGRPSLVASKQQLALKRTHNLVPAGLLLWALGTE